MIPQASDEQTGLKVFDCEISYGSRWIDLNDSEKFKIGGDSTRDGTSKSWRKITAQSPVLGGEYIVHAVPDMISEQISIWVYGRTQTDLHDNFWFLDQLFEQMDYRIRWTTNEYRETWRCQMADASYSRAQVWTHNMMAQSTFTVPRFPDVTRERV